MLNSCYRNCVSTNSVRRKLDCYFGPFGLLLLLTIYFLKLIYFPFIFFAHLISCRLTNANVLICGVVSSIELVSGVPVNYILVKLYCFGLFTFFMGVVTCMTNADVHNYY